MMGRYRMRERRTDCRYRMNTPSLVKSKSDGVAAGLILEASLSGLCLSLPFALPVNSEVEIRVENQTISGLVRNCTCIRAMEFQVGVELHSCRHLRLFERAQALCLYSPTRTSRVWCSPA